VSFYKYISQGQAVKVTVISKEENSQDFCLDFVQEFGLRTRKGPCRPDIARSSTPSSFPCITGVFRKQQSRHIHGQPKLDCTLHKAQSGTYLLMSRPACSENCAGPSNQQKMLYCILYFVKLFR
jgi:hypothetical protein